MADHDPNPDRQDRNVEVPGDTNSADIVDRTGEQMPQQTHDGLEDASSLPRRSVEDAEAGQASTEVNDEKREQPPGRISDW